MIRIYFLRVVSFACINDSYRLREKERERGREREREREREGEID